MRKYAKILKDIYQKTDEKYNSAPASHHHTQLIFLSQRSVKDCKNQNRKNTAQKYSCNYHIPKSDKVKTFLAVFNQLSGDKVPEAEIIKNMNSIPPSEVARLYKLVMNEIKAQQKSAITQDGATLERGFREISRIALRNGILPSALFFHVINEKSKRIKYGVDEV